MSLELLAQLWKLDSSMIFVGNLLKKLTNLLSIMLRATDMHDCKNKTLYYFPFYTMLKLQDVYNDNGLMESCFNLKLYNKLQYIDNTYY